MTDAGRAYWERTAEQYQTATRIRCDDFHYGPLLPGDRELRLLPPLSAGMRCLELGCGGAQNSIFLARRGAVCTALDSAGAQLAWARRQAARHDVNVRFVQACLSALPLAPRARFDLVHSSYALPFVQDPRRVLRAAARRLVPGGTLVLSTAHPLSTAEWLEVDNGETGLFVRNGFVPEPEVRCAGPARVGAAVCRPVLISRIFAALREAGLSVLELVEPRPLSAAELSRPGWRARVPYWSRAWLERAPVLERTPFVVVFVARRPLESVSAT